MLPTSRLLQFLESTVCMNVCPLEMAWENGSGMTHRRRATLGCYVPWPLGDVERRREVSTFDVHAGQWCLRRSAEASLLVPSQRTAKAGITNSPLKSATGSQSPLSTSALFPLETTPPSHAVFFLPFPTSSHSPTPSPPSSLSLK